MSKVVSIEKAEIESIREELIKQSAENEEKLKNFEDQILDGLKKANPDTILDHDDLIDTLAKAKTEANNIKASQIESKLKEEEIRIVRDKQVDLSRKTAILFFTLTDMVNIDHM